MKRLTLALVISLGLALMVFQFVSAHAFIDHCTPEVGSTVPQAPKELRCSFTDPIDPKQTTLVVYDSKNNQIDNKDLSADPNDPDGKTVVLTLNAAKIADGLYTVKWSTVSEDGHATDGQFQFAVGASTTQPGPAAAPAIPASVVISSPDESTSFPDDPAEVPITIQTSNFTLGQAGNHWQVYLDGQLALDVQDASTNAVLHAVPKGDHALKIALVSPDNTILATAGTGITVGPQDQQPQGTPSPSATPSAQLAPSFMPDRYSIGVDMGGESTLFPITL